MIEVLDFSNSHLKDLYLSNKKKFGNDFMKWPEENRSDFFKQMRSEESNRRKQNEVKSNYS